MTHFVRPITLFRTTTLAILWLLVSLAPSAMASDLKAVFHASAEVRGEEVRVGDIAVITGPECTVKNELADLVITKVSRPGQSVTIRQSYLANRLRASGLPMEAVVLELPDRVVVRRAAQELQPDWIRTIVKDYLTQIEPYRSGDWELVSLRSGSLPDLPEGDLGYRIMAQPSSSPTYLNLTVYLTVDGREAGQVRVSTRLNVFGHALIAASRMERDHRVGPEDIRLERISLSRLGKGTLIDPSQALGLTVRHRIQTGQPISDRDLYRAAAIDRGDMVTIVAEHGPMRITSMGQAKQDGAIGDNISVMNVNSKKVIVAEVIGPNTVRVNF